LTGGHQIAPRFGRRDGWRKNQKIQYHPVAHDTTWTEFRPDGSAIRHRADQREQDPALAPQRELQEVVMISQARVVVVGGGIDGR
jgi:hypothetical protein